MRVPWLQVADEAFELGDQLERALGAPENWGFRALNELWRWGLGLGNDDKPPDGICASPRAARLMAAAMRWRGDLDELVDVLCDMGLIERLDGGLRVKGTERYTATWTKNQRRPGGNRAETGRVPTGNREKPERQTQTQTQTHKKQKKEGADALPPVREQLHLEPTNAAVASPLPEAWAAVSAVFAEVTGSKYEVDRKKDPPALEALVVHGSEEVCRRLRRGLGNAKSGRYPGVTTVAQLRSKWNELALPVPGEAVSAAAPAWATSLHGQAWLERLQGLREAGLDYAASQLALLKPLRLEGEVLHVVSDDAFFAEHVGAEYGDLLANVVVHGPRAERGAA